MIEANADIVVKGQDRDIGGALINTNLKVPTIFIGGSPLLRTGFKHLLSGTRFGVLDFSFDDSVDLPDFRDEALVLLVGGIENRSARSIEMIRQIKARYPNVRVCVLADHFEIDSVMEACQAQADGFCLTTASRDVLIRSLELIMLGENIIPSGLVHSVFDRLARSVERQPKSSAALETAMPVNPASYKLSAREGEILRSLMQGSPNKVIARQFGVTEATVKVHVKAILRKIGAKNRTQAAMWATSHIIASAQSAKSEAMGAL